MDRLGQGGGYSLGLCSYKFDSELVCRNMDSTVGAPADLLPDNVLVYSEFGAIGVVASVFGPCIEGFLHGRW